MLTERTRLAAEKTSVLVRFRQGHHNKWTEVWRRGGKLYPNATVEEMVVNFSRGWDEGEQPECIAVSENEVYDYLTDGERPYREWYKQLDEAGAEYTLPPWHERSA